jgi:hypothetical protein
MLAPTKLPELYDFLALLRLSSSQSIATSYSVLVSSGFWAHLPMGVDQARRLHSKAVASFCFSVFPLVVTLNRLTWFLTT